LGVELSPYGESTMNLTQTETFEKCSTLVKIKKGENFNHRNISDISRIEI
jgi:hypothetical protein